MYSQDVLVAYSRDAEAAAQATHWRAEAGRARAWQRGRRDEALRNAVAAERRAVAAGVDWERLPRPPAGLRAPDRSGRTRIGRRLPPAGSPVPPSLGGLLRRTLSRAPAGPPPPAGPLTPEGGGVAAMAGNPMAAELTGPDAAAWLRSDPAPAHVVADGGAWLQAPDGSLWFRDAQRRHFALAADGRSLMPISDEGLLYAQDGAGGWRTSLADGTPLSLTGDGQLVNHQPDGTRRLLADDGLFYLVAPSGALYPIAADGEVLTEAGIGLDGGELVAWSPDLSDAGSDAIVDDGGADAWLS